MSIQCQLGNYNTIYSTVTLYTLAALTHTHTTSATHTPLISNTRTPHHHHMHASLAPHASIISTIHMQHHTHTHHTSNITTPLHLCRYCPLWGLIPITILFSPKAHSSGGKDLYTLKGGHSL